MLEIRRETEDDHAAVAEVLKAAFERPEEARLVATLRGSGEPLLSLVAVDEGAVVGHILLSPVAVEGAGAEPPPLGLGPMAVAPASQRQGVGSALVQSALQVASGLGTPFVVVVGHPTYYPRFGFEPAHEHGLSYSEEVPPEAFMVRELEPGALAKVAGPVRYHPLFDEV